jgi:hypothetical protein
MSVVQSGQALCIAAIAEATFASCVIPAAIPLAIEIGLLYSDPGQMEDASGQWKEVAKNLQGVSGKLDDLAKSVPSDKWSSNDRTAFDNAVAAYKTELAKVHDFHGSMGDMLDIASKVFFAAAVLALTLATMLAIQAVAILAASWTIVGAAAIEAVANTLAGAFDGIITACTLGVKGLMAAMVGIVVAGGVVQAVVQNKAGNPNGSGPVAFQKATLGAAAGPMPPLPT